MRDLFPDAAWFPVQERDIADVAVLALTEEGHSGQAYTLNGPELLTHRRQVECQNADLLLGFEDYGGDEPDPSLVEAFDPSSSPGPVPTAEAVNGRPARTFAQWAQDHTEEFRS